MFYNFWCTSLSSLWLSWFLNFCMLIYASFKFTELVYSNTFFVVESLAFFTYIMSSANRDNFAFFLDAFYFLSGHYCFVADLRGKGFSSFPLILMLSVGFSYMVGIVFSFFFTYFVESFYHEWWVNFVKCFLYIYEMIIWFFLSFSLMWCFTLICINICWTILASQE